MQLLNSAIWSKLSLRYENYCARIITHDSPGAVLLAGLFAVALTACQTLPLAGTASPTPQASMPAAHIGKRYIVDPQASEIRLLVYRDGPMARFGHNHVMIGQVQGELNVSDSAAASGFQLVIPVKTFVVDAPLPRAEEGEEFSAHVSDQARKGTRDNMLSSDVLDAAHYPEIRIASDSLVGPRWNPSVTAHISVRGNRSELKFPAAVIEQSGSLTVIAEFHVLQSDLGIKPFSVLGGAIRVKDSIEIRVRLVARPASQ
jgi:hypothetical protein